MRWSKLKQLVEQGVCDALRGRIAINSAAYGTCGCGHAWLTLDGDIVANFCTRANAIRKYVGVPDSPNRMYAHQYAEYGELSRQDAYKACWDFTHTLSIEDALHDSDPLVQTLAVIDRRVGKRRLKKMKPETLHPLARRLLEERFDAEQIRLPRALDATAQEIGHLVN